MIEIPRPKSELLASENLRMSSVVADYTQDFGRSALSRGFDRRETSHRSSFYESEKGRGTTLVDMDARGDITVVNGEEKRIATFGLGGCNAVALSAQLPDGTRKGYVQHYSPLHHQLGVGMLAEATERFMSEGATNVRAVVMTPGEWAQDPSSRWIMVPKDDLVTSLLTLSVQARISEADVQVYPYSEKHSSDRYGQGTLMVEFCVNGSVRMIAESMPINPLGK